MITRRQLIQSSFGAALLSALPAWGADGRPPRILLRNAWQTVNIGDIAHPIGVLTLLEKYIPEAQARLWPSSVADGVKELLMKRFPKLIILSGAAAIAEGIKDSDFFLHGSSSGFAAQAD